MSRPSWDAYYLSMARMVATRSTCNRLQVGCVLVTDDHRVLSSGFNGAPPGEPHCLDVGCDTSAGKGCQRTTHAEENACLWAYHQLSKRLYDGCTAYVTHSPCKTCAEKMFVLGVSRVVYETAYRDSTPLEWLSKMGVQVEQIE